MDASKKKSSLKKMTEAQKGYIGGILDGEGHLYISSINRNMVYSKVRVRITESCITTYLKKISGVGMITSYQPTEMSKSGQPKKRIYEWSVMKRADVRDLLNCVLDYLILKKKAAYVLLELESLKDQGAAHGIEMVRLKNALTKLQSSRSSVLNKGFSR